MAAQLAVPTSPDGVSAEGLAAIRGAQLDPSAAGAKGYGHERLDQLVTELLLGVR